MPDDLVVVATCVHQCIAEDGNGLEGIHFTLTVSEGCAVVGTRDGHLDLCDAESESYVRTFEIGKSTVHSLAIHPDQQVLLAGEESGALHQLRLPDGEVVAKFAAHKEATKSVAFAGSEVFITGSADRTVKYWKPDGTLLFTMPLPGSVRQLHVMADGKQLFLLLEYEHALRVWALEKLWQRFREAGIDSGLPALGY